VALALAQADRLIVSEKSSAEMSTETLNEERESMRYMGNPRVDFL
jgi:hypothetical protein